MSVIFSVSVHEKHYTSNQMYKCAKKVQKFKNCQKKCAICALHAQCAHCAHCALHVHPVHPVSTLSTLDVYSHSS